MSEPARYRFLPYAREGASRLISDPDTFGAPRALGESEVEDGRASARLSVTLRKDEADAGSIGQDMTLYGPGDVVAVDPRVILRTDPKPGVSDFEPNYLAAIEFEPPDFPWRYTPAAAVNKKLRPWLALIVLEADEVREKNQKAPLPLIEMPPLDKLPDLSESWAWAHVQEADGKPPISRIVCPRRLHEGRRYEAFLVPAFETGRRAGAGEGLADVNQMTPAWGVSESRGAVLPVYYRWSFATSGKGDFEYLVGLLKARRMDKRVGARDMDVSSPGFEVSLPDAEKTVGLEGALKSVETETRSWTGADFKAKVRAFLNRPAERQEAVGGDRIVAPPFYAQWHAGEKKLDAGSRPWIESLNLDPKHRAVAGFGTRVVQDQQEPLMAEAWDQIGAVQEANQLLRLAQFGRAVSRAALDRHLARLSPGALLSITAPVLSRISEGARTVRAAVGGTAVPAAALLPAFRRLTRGRGPFRQRWDPEGKGRAVDFVSLFNDGEVTTAIPHQTGGAGTISGTSDGLLPFWMPAWLRPRLRLLALFLAVLALVLLLVAFLLKLPRVNPVSTAAAALLSLAAYVWTRLVPLADAAAEVREDAFAPAVLASLPPQPGFSFVPGRPDDPIPAAAAGAADSADAALFRAAALDLSRRIAVPLFSPAVLPKLDLAATRATILAGLAPEAAISARVRGRLRLAAPVASQAEDDLAPIMAHPTFERPMYEALRDLSQELLLPGLQFVPPNTLGLLVVNRPFIEAYMAGLNHEMARELLWREYPTDQRGTYFRQFWDVGAAAAALPEGASTENLEDIRRVHLWGRGGALGEHDAHSVPPCADGSGHVVLLVRGDVLRKYPSTAVYAKPAVWQGGKRVMKEEELDADAKIPLFQGTLEPDVTFFGFDLCRDMVTGDIPAAGSPPPPDGTEAGWFFVLQEQPHDPRFGFDEADAAAAPEGVPTWNDLTWGHLLGDGENLDDLAYLELDRHGLRTSDFRSMPGDDPTAWGADGAQMAYISLQRPMRVAVHGTDMMPRPAP